VLCRVMRLGSDERIGEIQKAINTLKIAGM
jgi:hypothetical protein